MIFEDLWAFAPQPQRTGPKPQKHVNLNSQTSMKFKPQTQEP
jgi:hypothetical protein